jgi:hypothetical protein
MLIFECSWVDFNGYFYGNFLFYVAWLSVGLSVEVFGWEQFEDGRL